MSSTVKPFFENGPGNIGEKDEFPQPKTLSVITVPPAVPTNDQALATLSRTSRWSVPATGQCVEEAASVAAPSARTESVECVACTVLGSPSKAALNTALAKDKHSATTGAVAA